MNTSSDVRVSRYNERKLREQDEAAEVRSPNQGALKVGLGLGLVSCKEFTHRCNIGPGG